MRNIPGFDEFLSEAAKVKGKPKVLFIAYGSDGDEKAEKAAIAERCEPTFVAWSDLSIDLGEIKAKGRPITEWPSVFVGPIHENDRMATCLRDRLAGSERALFYGGSPFTNNKLLQAVRMRTAKVAQVDSLIADPRAVTAAQIVKRLGLPVVSKIPNGSKGKGVSKHDTEEALAKALKTADPELGAMIFQAFVPNEGDYRVFFVGTSMVYCIKRTRQGKDFRNNVSLGGKAEDAKLPKEARDLAKAANKAMAFEVCDITGVDLIRNKDTGEWLVMEINSSPQFLKGIVAVNAVMDRLVG